MMTIIPNLTTSEYNASCYTNNKYLTVYHRFWDKTHTKYGNMELRIYVPVLLTENKWRFTFDDPGYLQQGEGIPCGHSSYQMKEVLHVKYLSSVDYPSVETMQERGYQIGYCSDLITGKSATFGPVVVDSSDFSSVPGYAAAKLLKTVPVPSVWADRVQVRIYLGCERNAWGNLENTLYAVARIRDFNTDPWPDWPPTPVSSGFLGRNQWPTPCRYPSQNEIDHALEVLLTPLENFGAMIRRAREGDNFMFYSQGSVSNAALEQLMSSDRTQINWVENLGDLFSVWRNLKKGNLKALRKVRKRVNMLKRTKPKDLYRNAWKQISKDEHDIDSWISFWKSRGYSDSQICIAYQQYIMKNSRIYHRSSEKLRLAEKEISNLNRQKLSTILEFGADAWLAKRYLIDTTLMDLEEATSGHFSECLDTALTDVVDWEHVHASNDAEIRTLTGDTVCSGTISFSTWARPHITNAVQDLVVQQSRIGLVNLANLWDVIPFSFMIDWFTNLGDFLGRLDNQIGINAAHYEFDVSITSYRFTMNGMSAYLRIPCKGCTSYDLSAESTYSPSTRTWLKRINDTVAIVVGK
jgi:hypothetical protein